MRFVLVGGLYIYIYEVTDLSSILYTLPSFIPTFTVESYPQHREVALKMSYNQLYTTTVDPHDEYVWPTQGGLALPDIQVGG